MRLVNSLRARLSVGVTLAFAAWIALVCAGLLAYSHVSAVHKTDRLLTSTARRLALELTEKSGDAQARPQTPRADLLDEDSREDLTRNSLALLLVGADGRVVEQSRGPVPAWPLRADRDWRTAVVQAGEYTVVVGSPWRRTRDELELRAILLIAIAILAIAAVGIGSWVLVGRTLSPIALLAHQATTVSTENLQVRLEAPSRDAEVTELVTTLNGLLQRLAESAVARARFYAATSHELRTPLQALSGHLEVALSRDRSRDEYWSALQEALLQTRRLTRLVRDVLLLHQLDSGVSPPEREPVSIAAVCERVLDQLHPLIVRRQLQVQTQLLARRETAAPPTHAEVLVRNIIENAVRHADGDGRIRVSTGEDEDALTLTVANTSTWVPEYDGTVAGLTEARSGSGPSQGARVGGSGLGLAICSAISAANRWRFTICRSDGEVIATVVFPGDAASPSCPETRSSSGAT